MPFQILGAATATEFLASDCSIRLDLDDDDSSGAADSNYLALPLCPGITTVSVADSDAVFYSGYRVDSVRARLLPPMPNVPLEYLTAQPTGSVGVSGQGSPHIVLSVAASTAVAAANADFQSALRSLQWHNDAVSFTPGQRTVEVIAFAENGLRDTAYAYVPVPTPVSAGRDTAVTLCADAPPFNLAVMLESNVSSGGTWSPSTAMGGDVFSPPSDTSGVYSYLVSNGVCPADTATVEVSVLPQPVFSLGSDTVLCAGETLTLAAPSPAVWQDGTHVGIFTVGQTGLYWAEHTNASGCRWRDSVSVVVNQPVATQLSAASCAGQPYSWNNQTFSTDTSVCATFVATNGCDSLDCLNLSFFYPTLALDTSICAGQTLSWLGQTFSQPGVHLDTLQYNGCMTAVTIGLTVSPPDTVQMSATICSGESYSLGNQVFSSPGLYIVPFTSQSGCDSLVLLNLSVQQPVSVETTGGLCPGETYIWGNQTLDAPGVYRDTFGCDSVVTLTLSLLPVPMPQIAGATAICTGAVATLSALGNFSDWVWSGGENGSTISVVAGEHSVTVTDVNGCQGADTIFVTGIPPIEAVWDTASPFCYRGSDGYIELSAVTGGAGPLAFQLNGATASDSAVFSNLSAGTWNVLITDSAGCEAAFFFELTEPPMLAVDLGISPLIESGEAYLIPVQTSQAGPFVYAWSPPEGLSCTDCPNPTATATQTTTYTLFLENENGCTASDSLTLRVNREGGIYVPNIFSPNGDGHNEILAVFGDLSIVSAVELFRVFDRWGDLMFEAKTMALNNEKTGWDGTLRGKMAQAGVYTWFAEIRLADGTLLRKSGDVTILR